MYARANTQGTVRERMSRGSGHPMRYGDRMFVRIQLSDGRGVSFCSETLNDMTELLGEVRRRGRELSGLGRLQIRNASQGWSLDRPLRLYQRDRAAACRSATRTAPRMLMPWETH